jgi:hypothetical protein
MSKTTTLATPETDITERKKNSLATVMRRINKYLSGEFINWIEVGIDLKVIEDDKLFEQEGYTTFRDFVEAVYTQNGMFDFKQARLRINVGERYSAIKTKLLGNGDIRTSIKNDHPDWDDREVDTEVLKDYLPSSGTQLRELLSYKPVEAAKIFEEAAIHSKKAGAPMTGKLLREWRTSGIRDVESTRVNEKQATERATSWTSDQQPESPADIDFSTTEPEPIIRNGALIATLDAVEKAESEGLLPLHSRKNIENEIFKISERDLEHWGTRRDKPEFVKIGRLMLIVGLTYTQAFRFLEKGLKSESTLNDFINIAIAQGGHASLSFRGFQVDAREVAAAA